MARKAPYLCYNHREIREGDTLQRANGTKGKVVFTGHKSQAHRLDLWFVDYGYREMSRLAIEVGSEFRAMVFTENTKDELAKARRMKKVEAVNAKAKEPEFKIQCKFEEHKGTTEKDIDSFEVMSEADEVAVFKDHEGGPWFEQFQLTNNIEGIN